MLSGRYPVAILAHGRLTPKACDALADAIEDAIKALQGLGMTAHNEGRLRKAVIHLRRVAARGSYGTTQEELHLTAQAIHLANDIYAITRALPSTPDAAIVRELAAILGGTLDGKSSDRRAYEAQSQLWFGTLLAHSGLHPAILDLKKRRPDFIVQVESVRLAMEVKRPGSLQAIDRAIKSAANQIDSVGIPGFVVLDVSDVLLEAQAAGALAIGATSYREGSRPVFDAIATHAHDYLARYVADRQRAADEGRGQGCRAIGIIVYARFCVWEGNAPAQLDFGLFVSGGALDTTAARLYEHQTERMLGRLVYGLERLTGNPLQPL